jgi:hypothetical protein
VRSRTRKVDDKGRVTLSRDFAGSTVTIDRVGPDELRVRKLRPNRRRYSLKDLVARITAKNRHAEVSTGKRVGDEAG